MQQTIKHNFNRASSSYESVATVQRQSAEFLVQKLLEVSNNFYPQNILDLGTGTGNNVELLLNHYPNSLYLLNDIADKMLELCKLKFASNKNIMFSNTDMEILDCVHHSLVISNLALQWSKDLWKCIKKYYDKSDIFSFSTLINGTFEEWQDVINRYIRLQIINNYPKKSDLVDYCNNIKNTDKFYFWTREFCMEFKNCLYFTKYLKSLGANLGMHSLPPDILKKIVLNEQNTLTVTYKVFFGIFYKVK